MKVQVSFHQGSLENLAMQAIALFLPEGFKADDISEVANGCDFDLGAYLKASEFTGGVGQLCVASAVHKKEMVHIVCVGLGKKSKTGIDMEVYRRALGSVVVTSQAKKVKTLLCLVPDAALFDATEESLGQHSASIAHIAGYKFDTFKGMKDKKSADMQVVLYVEKKRAKKFEAGFTVGDILGKAVVQDREMIDCPPSRMTPSDVAKQAQKLAKEVGLKCTVFDEKDIVKMGMEGLDGVSRGSMQPARFVVLEYKTEKKNAKTIGFVGKGITFDSGGLSLKPADSMECMKDDMAGAASVICAMWAIAQLQPEVNVVACAPITENMPGNHALKPGDILKAYNGKTMEVLNTDAEGRLVLADALSYITTKYELAAVVDVATLTGACIYAVGPFYAALMSDNDELSEKVLRA